MRSSGTPVLAATEECARLTDCLGTQFSQSWMTRGDGGNNGKGSSVGKAEAMDIPIQEVRHEQACCAGRRARAPAPICAGAGRATWAGASSGRPLFPADWPVRRPALLQLLERLRPGAVRLPAQRAGERDLGGRQDL